MEGNVNDIQIPVEELAIKSSEISSAQKILCTNQADGRT